MNSHIIQQHQKIINHHQQIVNETKNQLIKNLIERIEQLEIKLGKYKDTLDMCVYTQFIRNETTIKE
jgi:hypothetical protein